MIQTHLTTVEQVFEALGGTTCVRDIARATSWQHADNWKARGRFAAHTYLVLTMALAERGLTADPMLWGITPAEKEHDRDAERISG